jgi:hypothetical protein
MKQASLFLLSCPAPSASVANRSKNVYVFLMWLKNTCLYVLIYCPYGNKPTNYTPCLKKRLPTQIFTILV